MEPVLVLEGQTCSCLACVLALVFPWHDVSRLGHERHFGAVAGETGTA
jgi:hypothetical protein